MSVFFFFFSEFFRTLYFITSLAERCIFSINVNAHDKVLYISYILVG